MNQSGFQDPLAVKLQPALAQETVSEHVLIGVSGLITKTVTTHTIKLKTLDVKINSASL